MKNKPSTKIKKQSKAKKSIKPVTAEVSTLYSVPKGKVLVLRTCYKDGRSPSDRARGFVWPTSGPVEAKDWNPEAVCGFGLHGALWGEGDGSLFAWDPDALWIVVEVEEVSIVNLQGKVKFPNGKVIFAGSRLDATALIRSLAPGSRSIIGGTATAGYRGTATAGHGGTATAGHGGTATAGYGGTATAGDSGTATAGNGGTATAGHSGTATAGYSGTATAGHRGTATAGYGGTATAGNGGTATAGHRGTATAGHRGTATAGYGGTATAGDGGELRIKEWDGANQRYRTRIAWVGENGILPNGAYVLQNGIFVLKA